MTWQTPELSGLNELAEQTAKVVEILVEIEKEKLVRLQALLESLKQNGVAKN